jgi:hypothetical protein
MHDTIDLIDQAFISRLQSAGETGFRSPGLIPGPPVRPHGDATMAAERPRPAAGATPVSSAVPRASLPMADVPADVKDVLDAAPEAWSTLADEIEMAVAAGCRVIAVVAVRESDGGACVARGAAAALASRGHRAICLLRSPLQQAVHDPAIDAADVVIVDAAGWFPPGPIRRQHLARLTFGCDAAVLVRRAERPQSIAHAEALAAIGLRVLGEVETCAAQGAAHAERSPNV